MSEENVWITKKNKWITKKNSNVDTNSTNILPTKSYKKVNSMNRNYVEEYIEKMESSLHPIKYNCKHHKLMNNFAFL